MRGGFLHNDVIVAQIAKRFEAAGGRTAREVPVRCGETTRFVDLVVQTPYRVISVEVELAARRVLLDIEKADALGADELWVVVPESALARSVGRQLVAAGARGWRCTIVVLTLGQALKRVGDCFPLIVGANTCEKQTTKPRRSPCGSVGPTC